MKALASWDRQTEARYNKWRAPFSDLHRAALAILLCAASGEQWILTISAALGCLLSTPVLALLLLTVLQYLLLVQLQGSVISLCVFYLVQVVPGAAAFPGQTLRQAALLLGAACTVLAQNWTGQLTEERLVLILGAVLSTGVLSFIEVIYRLQFAYKDFEGSGQSALQEVVQGLGSCVILLQPNLVLYFNEAAHKLLKAQTSMELSRRLAAFQLLAPGPNLSAGRNQPLWSEVNALARKPRPGEVQLRKYVLEIDQGRLAITASARCVKWQGETQAVVLTLVEAGGSEREAGDMRAVPSLDLRRLHNDIYASAKLARELPSSASFDDLDRSILAQYYQFYTAQDLADLAAGRHLIPVPMSVSIQEEAQRLIDFFNLQSHTKRINLQVTASPALPSRVTLDLIRLRQLLFPTLHYALSRSKEADVVHVNFSEIDGLQVNITYTSSGDDADPGLQAAVTLARSLGKGIRLQPGQLTFSVPCQASSGEGKGSSIGNTRS